MISAGQTKVTDIMVGRQLLCKEKPKTRVKSQCAKNVTKTVKAAKKGLTPAQQKLWRKYVYTSALLQARRYCENIKYYDNFAAEGASPRLTKAQGYSKCVTEVLSGTRKIEDLFKTKFKWSDYLVKGAAIIKKLPVARSKGPAPGGDDWTGTGNTSVYDSPEKRCKRGMKKMRIRGKKVCRPKNCSRGRKKNGYCKPKPPAMRQSDDPFGGNPAETG